MDLSTESLRHEIGLMAAICPEPAEEAVDKQWNLEGERRPMAQGGAQDLTLCGLNGIR